MKCEKCIAGLRTNAPLSVRWLSRIFNTPVTIIWSIFNGKGNYQNKKANDALVAEKRGATTLRSQN